MAERGRTAEREQAIFKFLRSQEGGVATIPDIHEAVTGALREDVSLQAYYKVVNRLVAVGKLEPDPAPGADGAQRYALARHVHAGTAMTLDDVYEQLTLMGPTEQIARLMEARTYYESRRATTIAKAAEALLEEDPRELVERFLRDRFESLRADIDLHASTELRDDLLEHRVESQFRELQLFAYRYLGLSQAAISAARSGEILAGRARLEMNEHVLRAELAARIFGDRFIEVIQTGGPLADLIGAGAVAGSDASTHGSFMRLRTAAAFEDDVGHHAITFNNSLVYVHPPARARSSVGQPYYTIPISRSALDDPGNKGIVLAPFMYRYLDGAAYEKMAKCATDVVQWRCDERVFSGTARALDGVLLPKPVVHIRDGTITPQEREYNHYRRPDEYGEMVREGIALSRQILERVRSSDGRSLFAGAVKATQIHFFSGLLNWYIASGSKARFGDPIDPNWDATRAAHIADNEAMSILLSTVRQRSRGSYPVTFMLCRPFHTLTEFFDRPQTDDFDWVAFFADKRDRELRAYESRETNEYPVLAASPEVADDSFVYMTCNADYLSFYVGHTAGDPPPAVPRYEFLHSVRRSSDRSAVGGRLLQARAALVEALDVTGISSDSEHNFMSKKTLVKLIPYVVFNAHEKVKSLGRKLESELHSIAVQWLTVFRRARTYRVSDIEFKPMTVKDFIDSYRRSVEDEEPVR